MDDRQLRRAGLDYRELARVVVHPDWEHCLAALAGRRMYAVSSRGSRLYTDAAYAPGDAFLFGPEAAGLPDPLLASFPEERRFGAPLRPGKRSPNLSHAVAVLGSEAGRQQGIADGAWAAPHEGGPAGDKTGGGTTRVTRQSENRENTH